MEMDDVVDLTLPTPADPIVEIDPEKLLVSLSVPSVVLEDTEPTEVVAAGIAAAADAAAATATAFAFALLVLLPKLNFHLDAFFTIGTAGVGAGAETLGTVGAAETGVVVVIVVVAGTCPPARI